MAGLADPTTFLWMAYVLVALALLGLVLKAGNRGAGNFILGALLVQQAWVTSGAVGFAVVDPTNEGAIKSIFAIAAVPPYLIWAPIMFLLGPALLGSPRQYRVPWMIGVAGALPGLILLVTWITGVYSPITDGFALTPLTTHALLLVFVAIAITMALLAREALTTPLDLRRGQFALLACAFGVEGGYHAAEGTTKVLLGYDFYGIDADWRLGLEMGIPLVVLLAVMVYALVTFVGTAAGKQRRWAGFIALTIAVSVAAGATAAPLGISEEAGDSRALFHPLIDLFALGLVTYAGLRFQLFNLERRAKQTLAISIPLVLGFLGFNIIQEMTEGMLAGTQLMGGLPAAGVVAATVVSISAVPLTIVGKKVATALFPNVLGTPDYTKDRKYQIYISALEGALVDGVQTPGETSWLKRLRQELGIPDAEHARLEADVRAKLASPTSAPQPPVTSAPGGSP